MKTHTDNIEKVESLEAKSQICRRCGRKLKKPDSIEVGIGPTCARRESMKTQMKPLFNLGWVSNLRSKDKNKKKEGKGNE